MPLCRVNIDGDRPENADAARDALAAALSRAAPGAPVIVMIHGFKHSPWSPANDPHDHILSLAPRRCWKAVSWPGLLGLSPGAGTATGGAAPGPVCIALGWRARGTIWQAYARAAAAGAGLAQVVAAVHALRPGARVGVLAHSLGARVALSALPHLAPGQVSRAVLLAPAEARSRAARALSGAGGRGLDVLNVTSRENALFDAALGWSIGAHLRGDRPLGHGLGAAGPRWLDLRIDDAATRAGLARLGIEIAAPDRLACHWSVYLRAGVFDLYRAFLAGGLDLARLRAALPAPDVAPPPIPAAPIPAPIAAPMAARPDARPLPDVLPGVVPGARGGLAAR